MPFLWFAMATINKNYPSHVSASIYHTYTDQSWVIGFFIVQETFVVCSVTCFYAWLAVDEIRIRLSLMGVLGDAWLGRWERCFGWLAMGVSPRNGGFMSGNP